MQTSGVTGPKNVTNVVTAEDRNVIQTPPRSDGILRYDAEKLTSNAELNKNSQAAFFAKEGMFTFPRIYRIYTEFI